MLSYYIYQHIRLDNGLIFYVGKGCNDRAFSKKDRNKYWHHIVNKYGYDVQIIQKNLSLEQSWSEERKLIKQYRDIGIDLVNVTDGGNGGPLFKGKKHTKISKEKISQKAKNRELPKEFSIQWGRKNYGIQNGNYSKGYWRGRKRSVETKEKIRQALLKYYNKLR